MKCDGAYKELKPCSCHYEVNFYERKSCATEGCKRPPTIHDGGDYWCGVDFKRIKKLNEVKP